MNQPKATKLNSGHKFVCEDCENDNTPAVYEIEYPHPDIRWTWLCQSCFDKWDAQEISHPLTPHLLPKPASAPRGNQTKLNREREL